MFRCLNAAFDGSAIMHWIALLGRLSLSAVFLVAAIGKLTDRRGSRQALAEFGVPGIAATPIAFVLPMLEIAIAALLLFSTSARTGALAAIVLLGVFITGMAVSLARGRRPDCHCFGQLHSAPVGSLTVLRNVLLAAVAGVVLWQGGENPHLMLGGAGFSAVAWIALVVAAAALTVAAVEGWLLLGVLPQQGRLLTRLEALEAALGQTRASGLPVGENAPAFVLRDLAGNRVSLATLRSAGRSILLFFTNPHCAPCDDLLPKVGRWQREHGDRVNIAIISRDSIEMNLAKSVQHGLQTVLLQKKREMVEAYRVESTPAAVRVSADGSIASQIAYGPEAIEALVEQAVGLIDAGADTGHTAVNGRVQHAEHRAMAIGQLAPSLLLPDLNGKPTSLTTLKDGPTLVLFWNPDCGFCQQLLPELKAWDRKRPAQSPQLLVVSNGDVGANRALGFASPVLLDADGTAMREFGASGTPMAVLVDAGGRIASYMAAGAHEVMALASAQQSEAR
jgi:thiol-disulfide isomerase/thioredoxin